jgi:hypothetical protein
MCLIQIGKGFNIVLVAIFCEDGNGFHKCFPEGVSPACTIPHR